MPPALRSVMSVMVGFLALNVALSLESSLLRIVFHGKLDSTGYLVARLVVSVIAAAVAGFVCAVIAPGRPLVHAGVIAAILLTFSISAYYRLQGDPQPNWYLLSLTIVPPLAVMGGAALDFPELKRQK